MPRYQYYHDLKKQHGLHSAREASRRKGNESMKSSPFRITATLDIQSQSYILSLIINQSSNSTLAILLRCSRFLFKAASPRLYRNLHLSQQHFKSLIETGYDPIRRGTTSGLLGRSFSPYLHEALSKVKTLYITDYRGTWTIPSIPRGAFRNLEHVVLLREPSFKDWKSVALPTDFLNRLNRDLRSVTIMIIDAWRMECTPTCFRRLQSYARNEKDVQIMLLPFLNLDYEHEKTGWSDMVRFRKGISKIMENTSTSLVGGEYAFIDKTCNKEKRFIEWLDQPAARLLFTVKEEELLRANDRDIWALRRNHNSC